MTDGMTPRSPAVVANDDDVNAMRHDLATLRESHAAMQQQYTQLKADTDKQMAELQQRVYAAQADVAFVDGRWNDFVCYLLFNARQTIKLQLDLSESADRVQALEQENSKLRVSLDSQESALRADNDELVRLVSPLPFFCLAFMSTHAHTQISSTHQTRRCSDFEKLIQAQRDTITRLEETLQKREQEHLLQTGELRKEIDFLKSDRDVIKSRYEEHC